MQTKIRLTAKLKAAKEQEARGVVTDALNRAGITGGLRSITVSKRGNGTLFVGATIVDPTGEYAEHLAVSTEAKAKGVALSWGITEQSPFGEAVRIPLMYPWCGPKFTLREVAPKEWGAK